MALTERDRLVLDFESAWWLYPGPKDQAIREYLGISATRFYQVLRRLVDNDEALAYAPMTVRRLRKVRSTRREQLAARLSEPDSGR